VSNLCSPARTEVLFALGWGMINTQKRDEGSAKPSKREIEEQLSRMLASGELKLSPRAAALLTFVVNEAIAGRSDYLKAFTIATQVFGRDSKFDAQSDPCVRIEAARVRRGLERYYLVRGTDDTLEITIPKGSYRPVFRKRGKVEQCVCETISDPDVQIEESWREHLLNMTWPTDKRGRNVALALAVAVPVAVVTLGLSFGAGAKSQGHEARDTKPYVVVSTFEDSQMRPELTDTANGAAFRDEMILHLVSDREIAVLIEPLGTEGRVRNLYTLHGAVRRAKQAVRLSARLVRDTDGAVVWAESDDHLSDLRHATEGSAQRFSERIRQRIKELEAAVEHTQP